MLALASVLASCGSKSDEPVAKGQVVATVGDKEITIHELNAELGGAQAATDEERKAQRTAALEALIGRTILTGIARERKLDQTPAYLLQKRRADEVLLVQMLQRDISSQIIPPTRDDAMKYIGANPDLFAQRKIYSLDQIQFKTPRDQALIKALEPLKTMEQVEQQMIESRQEYRRAPATLDTAGVPPALVRRIASLPPGEIFVVPTGPTMVANRIVSTQVVPLVGDQAVDRAMTLIQEQAVGEKVDKELKARVEAARKAVRFQPGFGPDGDAPAAGKTTKS